MSEESPARRRPSGLGRGLSSLLGEVAQEAPVSGAPNRGNVQMMPVSSIEPHLDQPRRHFDEAALEELAASIETRGLIQPIVVRPHGHRYQIVAGERRWRAAQKARLHDGRLSMGHARALITAIDPEGLAQEVVDRGLSVRDTERMAKFGKPGRERQKSLGYKGASADIEALERQLGDMLGLKVKITHRPDGGCVALNYSTLDQLDMICQRLSGERI